MAPPQTPPAAGPRRESIRGSEGRVVVSYVVFHHPSRPRRLNNALDCSTFGPISFTGRQEGIEPSSPAEPDSSRGAIRPLNYWRRFVTAQQPAAPPARVPSSPQRLSHTPRRRSSSAWRSADGTGRRGPRWRSGTGQPQIRSVAWEILRGERELGSMVNEGWRWATQARPSRSAFFFSAIAFRDSATTASTEPHRFAYSSADCFSGSRPLPDRSGLGVSYCPALHKPTNRG